jgi:predicted short-subunit dehydrogenase-like oxidoreductase (DUF2520 family)
MKQTAGQKIVILGCGNVAWHIAKHLNALGGFSVHVYNHRPNPVLEEFRKKLKCRIESNFENILPTAEFYFIAVADHFIAAAAKKLNISNPNAILLHTSGSAKIKELGNNVHGTGVFYPLQSFSKNDEVEWSRLPLLIEGNDKATENRIRRLAIFFSYTVLSLPYKERLRLHLAAVFVNNFSNALYVAADESLKKNSAAAGFKLLLPLIDRTTAKVRVMSPKEAQTGPAKRKDREAMQKHLDLLSKNPQLKKLYKQLSRLIDKQQNG